MELYSIDKDNVNDFQFLLTPEAVQGLRTEDGTASLAVKHGQCHIGAIAGKYIDAEEYAITSLFVLPAYRRHGAAAMLLHAMEEAIEDKNAVFSFRFTTESEETRQLSSFLEAKGFEEYQVPGSSIIRMTLEKMADSKLAEFSKKPNCTPFSRIPSNVLKSFDPGKKKGFVPLPAGGLRNERVDGDCSMGIVKDNQLEGFGVVERLSDGTLLLSSLYIDKKQPYPMFTGLIGSIYAAAVSKYDKDTVVLMPTVNDASAKFVDTLFHEGDIEEIFTCYRRNISAGKKTEDSEQSLSEFLASEQMYVYGDAEEGKYLTEVTAFYE